MERLKGAAVVFAVVAFFTVAIWLSIKGNEVTWGWFGGNAANDRINRLEQRVAELEKQAAKR